MIDWLIEKLFKWDRLRMAIFAEVDWYNSISRTLNDPEAMEIASAFWCESDGWRGWSIKDNGTYYFHDIAEKSISDIMYIINTLEEVYE